jgi:hypothetical protein
MTELARYYEAFNEEREFNLTTAALFAMACGLSFVYFRGLIGRSLAFLQFLGAAYFLYLGTIEYARKKRRLFGLLDSNEGLTPASREDVICIETIIQENRTSKPAALVAIGMLLLALVYLVAR